MTAIATSCAHGVRVRDAQPADNEALITLAASCPMAGDIVMCVDRASDFFALTRLEGDRSRVGVAERDGEVIGCVTVSERCTYLNGDVTPSAYVGDLKVAPAHRGGPSADALEEYARAACRELVGDDGPTLITVLDGNTSMERRTNGPRGLPRLTRCAGLVVHAIPFLVPRRQQVEGVYVEQATDRDLEEMAALWTRVAPGRQWAPVLDAESLRDWIGRAPGLEVHDFLVARRADGRLAGFVGLWDQRGFKQLRVLHYSARLARARLLVNAVSRLAGARVLPAAGNALDAFAAVMPCVAESDSTVLRALLLHTYEMNRRSGHLFFTITLDERDPLRVAFRGLLAQPTRVGAYVTSPAGRYHGPQLDGRPMHFESALV